MLALKNTINSRLLFILFLGFSSGLPLALTGSTLQAWYTEANVSLMTIGLLSLVGIPYVWKFMWAPFMDRFTIPWMDRRKGWICVMQIALCTSLFFLSSMNPQNSPKFIGLIALLIAFLSASQDISIDAYRTDILKPEERGIGSAYFIFSYRLAMLFSGGFALVLADKFGWQLTYQIMAILLGFSALITYFAPRTKPIDTPKTFVNAIVLPFVDLIKRDGIWLILLFVAFYKMGDALAVSLLSNFLLKELGFSLTEVGIIYKSLGLLGTVIGAFLGGLLLIRVNLYNALLWFGLAQAFSNLLFMFLAFLGKNYFLMCSAIFIENFFGGMSTAALMAFLMSLCHPQFSATQYAVLSALSVIGRVVLGPLAAFMVAYLGWVNFYFWSFVLCFPGILFLSLMRKKVKFNAEAMGY